MDDMKVGFASTRFGLSANQVAELVEALGNELEPITEFHHGDCIGGDADGYEVAVMFGIWVVSHPPIRPHLRAFLPADEERPPADYMVRNRSIVDDTDVLLAAPYEDEEKPTGGTWRTVRYSRARRGRVVLLRR
jgi:hypothetical protein